MATRALLTSFGANEEAKEKAGASDEGLGALKEKPPVAEPSEKPEEEVEPGAGREKENPVDDAEEGGAKEVAAVAAGGGAVKDKVAGGGAVPEDAGKDGKTEDAAEAGATEDDDDSETKCVRAQQSHWIGAGQQMLHLKSLLNHGLSALINNRFKVLVN